MSGINSRLTGSERSWLLAALARATSTGAASQTFKRSASGDIVSVTFSLASADGLRLYASPDGPMTAKSGQDLAPASLLPPLASAEAPPTSAICGPSFTASSPSADPAAVFGEQVAGKDGREWLAGVRADLEAWDMQSGPPICALRACEKAKGRVIKIIASMGQYYYGRPTDSAYSSWVGSNINERPRSGVE